MILESHDYFLPLNSWKHNALSLPSPRAFFAFLFTERLFATTSEPGRLEQATWMAIARITPFKIDQNKNQNLSIDKVQNLGNKRRYIYKDPRQDSGQRNISYTRYPKKCFTQTYRDLYGDAMLVLTWISSNMEDGNQQKHLRGTQRGYSSKPLNIALLNVF